MSRELKLSRNTIKSVLSRKTSKKVTRSKIIIDPETLSSLYKRCDGWGQRIHELLSEEYSIKIGYSTLMRLLNQHGYGTPSNSRCEQEETKPGLEMQHDTSPYRLCINGVRTNVVASLLYYRYSKQRYLKFYPNFRRFEMKSFFYEALMHYQYSSAVLRGCLFQKTL